VSGLKGKYAGKKIMIIPGTWEQVPLIKKAKEMGFHVIVMDSNPNADGFRFADEHEEVNPRNLPKVLEVFEKHKPDAVTSDECDYSYFAQALLSEIFGVPGPELKVAQLATNKKLMKQRCRECGILQPEFYPCTNLDQARKAVERVGFPAVIKPVDSRGAIGTTVISSLSELKGAFCEAIANSHAREILVEEFIRGVPITVDGYAFSKTGHKSLAIASKEMLSGRKPVVMEVVYPAQIPKTYIEKAIETNERLMKAFGIKFGGTHTEYVIDEVGELYFMETHNRGGGVYTSPLIIPVVSGVDMSECLILDAMGEGTSFKGEVDFFRKAVILKFFHLPKGGKIKKILNLDEVKKMEGVIEFFFMVKEGQVIEEITSGARRHGFVIVEGGSVEEARRAYDRAFSRVEVVYEKD
jgi:biotin carboxylase